MMRFLGHERRQDHHKACTRVLQVENSSRFSSKTPGNPIPIPDHSHPNLPPAPNLRAICTGFGQKRVALQPRPAESGQIKAKTDLPAQIPYCFRAAEAGS
jgi:hypothetical protein